MDKQLWEIGREQWQNMRPRKTYQDIADESGVSVNAAAPICKALGVSIDDCYGIKGADHSTQADDLRKELTHTKQMCRVYKRAAIFEGVLVGLALLALIIDLLNPNVGWIRRAFHIGMQWLNL